MKSSFTALGFVLFLLGFVGVVLQLSGIKLSILTWTENWGSGFGYLIKFIIILLGVIIAAISKTDFSGEDE